MLANPSVEIRIYMPRAWEGEKYATSAAVTGLNNFTYFVCIFVLSGRGTPSTRWVANNLDTFGLAFYFDDTQGPPTALKPLLAVDSVTE